MMDNLPHITFCTLLLIIVEGSFLQITYFPRGATLWEWRGALGLKSSPTKGPT